MAHTDITDVRDSQNAAHLEELTQEVQQIWPGFHHKILGKLGEGGCGRTLKILWTLSRKPAVLKYLLSAASAQLLANPEAKFNNLSHKSWQRLLEQEASVLWAFRDFEAAVTPLELHSSFVAFVMEFIPNGTLQENLHSNLDWREKVTRMLPVIELLSALQEDGLYHRDIALDNLFLTAEHRLKLGDFGLVHHVDKPIVQLLGCGKPGYLHPDIQNLRKPVRGQFLRNDLQDVYALCICLMGWVKGIEPNAQKSRNWLREGVPTLTHALDPFLFPTPPYPTFATGIGSFAELHDILTKVAKPARSTPVRQTPSQPTSRITEIHETYSSMKVNIQQIRAANFENAAPSNAVISGAPVLTWIDQPDLAIQFGFVPESIVHALSHQDPAWPEAPLVPRAPFPDDERLAGAITWDQAMFLAGFFNLHLPSPQQARALTLPGGALTQIWTNHPADHTDLRYTLVENSRGVAEKNEFRGNANPYRICCLIRTMM
ncbi:protein kinase domain-containing protein [Acanthopleuribacter pedis]|uniref:Protein kinase family protein n=1 Tax=Acanthopleuribacter pedis TaxID=442870 RepID=A0A8J7QIM6_9BACT|nr:protein kinase [Acanthopleuribacter pedis]MBO1319013.1 protein kinase family protein [Acanthopleuribacter pedis]